MSKILLAGSDYRLLATRSAVLARIGASVVSCDALEAMKALEREKFDLVVLCHSLTEKQATEITQVVRRSSKAKILMIVSDVSRERFYGSLEFDATSSPDPDRLVHRTAELLRSPTNHLGQKPVQAIRRPLTSKFKLPAS